MIDALLLALTGPGGLIVLGALVISAMLAWKVLVTIVDEIYAWWPRRRGPRR